MTWESMDARVREEGRGGLEVPIEPVRRRRSSKEFKNLCGRFEGGMESAAKMKLGSYLEFYTFSNLGASVGKTSTSPKPTFSEGGGRRKFRQSKLNFPRYVMRGKPLLAESSTN